MDALPDLAKLQADDLVTRLLAHPGIKLSVAEQFLVMFEQRKEAAAEITRLRAELDHARMVGVHRAYHNPT